MIYYYQVRTHHHKTEPVPRMTCPLCHQGGQMHMSILQKYTWMIGPMAPSRKYAIAWCENCGNYIPRVKWTDEMDNQYVHLKEGLKTPSRLYLGLWVVPLLIILLIGGIIAYVKLTSARSKDNQAFIQEATMKPQPGDLFQVNHSQGTSTYYTYYKVARVSPDSVYVLEATAHAADMKAWDDVPTDAAAYNAVEKSFSLDDLRESEGMFRADEDGSPAYGLVFGLYRDGKLHKKY